MRISWRSSSPERLVDSRTPVIALVGPAGILIGEQLVPLAKRWIVKEPVNAAVIAPHMRSHAFTCAGKAPDAIDALQHRLESVGTRNEK
jgi:xanthosine utilization system XapX-like protein